MLVTIIVYGVAGSLRSQSQFFCHKARSLTMGPPTGHERAANVDVVAWLAGVDEIVLENNAQGAGNYTDAEVGDGLLNLHFLVVTIPAQH